jgi:hypothetical protein
MRSFILAAAVLAAGNLFGVAAAQAQQCDCQCQSGGLFAGCDCGSGGCDECEGWAGRLFHHGHQPYIEGRELGFNCGCNGSYNYPVPPLYTYHWPGMYKQVRMTDYHSPWRFPPLKPYVDEQPIVEVGVANAPSRVRQVSASEPLEATASRPGEVTSMSSRLNRLSR